MKNSKHHTHLSTATMALAAMLVAAPAGAYQFQETADGTPVRWAVSEIVLTLDPSLESLGPMDRVEETITAAFERWVVKGDLPLDFTIVRGTCGGFGYDPEGPNENCLMARRMGQDSSHTGATTRLSYSSPSGTIVDADIIFNLDAGSWSLDGEEGAIDLADVALHEAGHFLGMAHSDVDEARMYPSMAHGATQQGGLHEDDIDGAAHLYAGFVDPSAVISCAVAAAGSSRPSLAGLLLAALGLGAVARRIAR